MAIIATAGSKAEVRAMGSAMDATVDLNGSLMEMLVTVYSYIMMSAIREAIQNGTDAVRRVGLSFSDGVTVHLPTASDPVITVVDKGPGMTQTFMETKYLSMGSSTKAGDNGAAGGLGIGRFAAYGYIRESYITTCHASDMVERTYFLFQGPDGKPQFQLASEVPGTVVGTKVQFPVKESDLPEAMRAVAWLKEVMQLTMGDSFSVDNPAALPTVLPNFCGTVITLEGVDSGLAGVRIYPMQGKNLKYNRHGLQDGALVVLANQEAGVGGLPFHVQSPAGDESVFRNGMVVVIPMSFNVAFMPSREEIKYTDEVNALLKRIDAAAGKAVVAKAAELFSAPSLACKGQLSDLLGNEQAEDWNWFARATRSHTNPPSELKALLSDATGGHPWAGSMPVQIVSEMRTRAMTIKFTSTFDQTLRNAFSSCGTLSYMVKDSEHEVVFHPNRPVALVVNDLKTGGIGRFRSWLQSYPSKGTQKFVFFSSEVPGEAQAAATALNAVYGGVLAVHHTSTMPAVARMVVGSAVRASRARGGALTYYCCTGAKQMSDSTTLASCDKADPVRVWVRKDGGALGGFKKSVDLASLTSRWTDGNLSSVLCAANVNKLYLLTTKQATELERIRAELQADGLWELEDDEFSDDDEGQEALAAVKALKGWKSLEALLAEQMAGASVQAVLAGRKVHTVTEDWAFNQFIQKLAAKPRMELTGTRVDKAFAPYIDLLTGTVRTQHATAMSVEFRQFVMGLGLVGDALELDPSDDEDRKNLIETMRKLKGVGVLNYALVYQELKNQFPLLATVHLPGSPATGVDHLCQALGVLYR